jgi:hypothetical protein|tara:strand:- start:133 stop:342 length:210 start_codon:yes stop_codon:yes gene_type:complete
MAKVTRSTAGAKHVSNQDKFNGVQFADFVINVKPAGGRAERLAMKQRLAEAKATMKDVVTTGLVFAHSC